MFLNLFPNFLKNTKADTSKYVDIHKQYKNI